MFILLSKSSPWWPSFPSQYISNYTHLPAINTSTLSHQSVSCCSFSSLNSVSEKRLSAASCRLPACLSVCLSTTKWHQIIVPFTPSTRKFSVTVFLLLPCNIKNAQHIHVTVCSTLVPPFEVPLQSALSEQKQLFYQSTCSVPNNFSSQYVLCLRYCSYRVVVFFAWPTYILEAFDVMWQFLPLFIFTATMLRQVSFIALNIITVCIENAILCFWCQF